MPVKLRRAPTGIYLPSLPWSFVHSSIDPRPSGSIFVHKSLQTIPKCLEWSPFCKCWNDEWAKICDTLDFKKWLMQIPRNRYPSLLLAANSPALHEFVQSFVKTFQVGSYDNIFQLQNPQFSYVLCEEVLLSSLLNLQCFMFSRWWLQVLVLWEKETGFCPLHTMHNFIVLCHVSSLTLLLG